MLDWTAVTAGVVTSQDPATTGFRLTCEHRQSSGASGSSPLCEQTEHRLFPSASGYISPTTWRTPSACTAIQLEGWVMLFQNLVWNRFKLCKRHKSNCFIILQPIQFRPTPDGRSGVSVVSLQQPLEARYIRIVIMEYIVAPCLKVELMGCSRQDCVGMWIRRLIYEYCIKCINSLADINIEHIYFKFRCTPVYKLLWLQVIIWNYTCVTL